MYLLKMSAQSFSISRYNIIFPKSQNSFYNFNSYKIIKPLKLGLLLWIDQNYEQS